MLVHLFGISHYHCFTHVIEFRCANKSPGISKGWLSRGLDPLLIHVRGKCPKGLGAWLGLKCMDGGGKYASQCGHTTGSLKLLRN